MKWSIAFSIHAPDTYAKSLSASTKFVFYFFPNSLLLFVNSLSGGTNVRPMCADYEFLEIVKRKCWMIFHHYNKWCARKRPQWMDCTFKHGHTFAIKSYEFESKNFMALRISMPMKRNKPKWMRKTGVKLKLISAVHLTRTSERFHS